MTVVSLSCATNSTGEAFEFCFLQHPEQIAAAWQELSDSFTPPLAETIPDIPTYAKKLATYASTLACYSLHGDLLGCISFYTNDCKAQEAYIAELATNRHFQGLGIGKALMEHACETSRTKGMRSIRLEVRKNNVAAQRFYAKQGFVFEEEGDKTIFLKKWLAD